MGCSFFSTSWSNCGQPDSCYCSYRHKPKFLGRLRLYWSQNPLQHLRRCRQNHNKLYQPLAIFWQQIANLYCRCQFNWCSARTGLQTNHLIKAVPHQSQPKIFMESGLQVLPRWSNSQLRRHSLRWLTSDAVHFRQRSFNSSKHERNRYGSRRNRVLTIEKHRSDEWIKVWAKFTLKIVGKNCRKCNSIY